MPGLAGVGGPGGGDVSAPAVALDGTAGGADRAGGGGAEGAASVTVLGTGGGAMGSCVARVDGRRIASTLAAPRTSRSATPPTASGRRPLVAVVLASRVTPISVGTRGTRGSEPLSELSAVFALATGLCTGVGGMTEAARGGGGSTLRPRPPRSRARTTVLRSSAKGASASPMSAAEA